MGNSIPLFSRVPPITVVPGRFGACGPCAQKHFAHRFARLATLVTSNAQNPARRRVSRVRTAHARLRKMEVTGLVTLSEIAASRGACRCRSSFLLDSLEDRLPDKSKETLKASGRRAGPFLSKTPSTLKETFQSSPANDERFIRCTREASWRCISSAGKWTLQPCPGSTHSKR